PSRQVAAQHQRGPGPLVISRAAADLAEAGASVEFAGRFVAFVDLEENGSHPEPRETAEVEIDELPRKSARAAATCGCDGEDFCFVRGAAREDEADRRASARGDIADDVVIEQQLLELVLAPAAIERRRMQSRESRNIACRREPKRHFARAEQ